MNNKRYMVGFGILALVVLVVTLAVASYGRVLANGIHTVPAVLQDSGWRDAGASGRNPESVLIPVTGQQSSSFDVGAGAPWAGKTAAQGSEDLQAIGWRDAGAGGRGSESVVIPITGQSGGWRDAGAGGRNQ